MAKPFYLLNPDTQVLKPGLLRTVDYYASLKNNTQFTTLLCEYCSHIDIHLL